jgi:hypothetical protein
VRRRPGRFALLAAVAALVASAAVPTTSADALIKPGMSRLVPTASWLAANVGGESRGAAYHPLVLPAAANVGPVVLGPTLSVRVSSTPFGAAMPPGFLGLSLEFGTLPTYLGTDAAAIDPVFLALVRGVNPGQAPILRIGGNSTDKTWWPVRGMARPGGVRFGLTGQWLAVVRAMAADLGARMILGVNLAADSPQLAAAEARQLIGGIGRHNIAALEIGNEPDDYSVIPWYRRHGHPVYSRPPTYRVSDYIRQFTRWRLAMPRTHLAGPALARSNWMAALTTFLRREPRVRIVTYHRYPLRACEVNPQRLDYPTIPRLLANAASTGLAQQVSGFAAVAHAARLPFRLDELNSASCTGKFGVSNTFASSLWILDTLFSLASVGVDGVNIHMLPGSAYQAFAISHAGGQWSASVNPLYYGMLAFARAFPRGARLLGVSAPAGDVKAWATRAPDGRLRIVLINKDASRSVNVRLRIPGAQTPLTSQALKAPSLAATGGVSLGGETFGPSTSTGVLPANPHPTTVPALLGYYTVPLPAGSAVLLTR